MSSKIYKRLKSFFESNYGLREIIEITYAYERRGSYRYNKTLFCSLIDCSDIDSYDEYFDHVGGALSNIIDVFLGFVKELEHGSGVDVVVANYCLYAADMVRFALLGLPFELEKAGFDHGMDEQEIKEHLQELEKLEGKWFGKKVCEDTFESSRVVYYLESFLRLYGNVNFTKQDYSTFEKYITIVKENSRFDPEFLWDDENEWIMSNDEYFSQQIPREIYMQIFQQALAFYGIKKYIHIDSRSSIYDGVDALYIPDSEGYATMSLQRIMELLQHEIEVHYLIQENTTSLLPVTDGANSLFREEGLAKFMEETLNGATIVSIDISHSLCQILPAEVLTGEEMKKFIALYWKLRGKEEKSQGYLLRRKRNYSLNYSGTQHKDVTYSRGRFQVRGWLLNGGDFKKLYYAKVSFEDMEYLDEILTNEQKVGLLYPLFLTERVLHQLILPEGNFLEYLFKKYPFINFEKYPSLDLSKEQKSIVEIIVGLIKNSLLVADYPGPSL